MNSKWVSPGVEKIDFCAEMECACECGANASGSGSGTGGKLMENEKAATELEAPVRKDPKQIKPAGGGTTAGRLRR